MRSILCSVVLLCCTIATGNEDLNVWDKAERPVVIAADSAEVDLSPFITILNEAERTYSVDEITSGNYDSLFSAENNIEREGDVYRKSFWVKIKIRSTIDRDTRWVLKTDRQYSDVSFYVVNAGLKEQVQHSGWSVPPARRSVPDPDVIFNLHLQAKYGVAVYLHVSTNLRWSTVDRISASLIPEHQWISDKIKNYTFLSVYAGICLLALFYWMFTYRHSPKSNYIYLMLATLSALIFCLDIYGITAVIWVDDPWYFLVKYGQHYFWLPLMIVSHFAISYKANSFVLHFPANVRTAYWIVCCSTVILLMVLPAFMPWRYSHTTGLMMIMFCMCTGVILITHLLSQRGFRTTGFAFLAILPIFIGMGTYILVSLGIVSERYKIMMPIGALITVIMYFYGMAYYVRALIEKRDSEMRRNDQLIREQNIVLEQTIEERTAELKAANVELSRAIRDLKDTHQKLTLAEQIKTNEKINTLLKEQELKSVTRMMEVQERERKRIAADLHDRLGSMLSTVKLYFSTIEDQLDGMNARYKDQYDVANRLLDEACDEVRKISSDMISGELIKFGLVSSLRQLAKTIEDTGRLKINILQFGLQERMDNTVEITLYRVIQELMNNILKHSKATEVNIQVNRTANELNIMVMDNGVGFDVNAPKEGQGMGLYNMAARIKSLNGYMSIDSGKGRGTTSIIDIPV